MHHNPPLVSIITPSYNAEKFISKTIESVINQTYLNWEMIIVDDCSTDDTISIIKSFSSHENRIILIENQINVGAAETRNIALRKAKGNFIAFLDSDDIWLNKKLETQINFMIDNDRAFTFSNYNLIDEKGNDLLKEINVPKSIGYFGYLKNTIIGCLTVVVNKEKVGYFEMPLIKSSHDMALWLLIMKRGFIAYGIPNTLASYRLVSNSNTVNKQKAALDVWRVYREFENLNIIKSSFYFTFYAFNAILRRL